MFGVSPSHAACHKCVARYVRTDGGSLHAPELMVESEMNALWSLE